MRADGTERSFGECHDMLAFNLFMRDYSHLAGAREHQGLVQSIIDTFQCKLTELETVWDELPSGAVHGDLSPNNVLLDPTGIIAGIVDFHTAGDEVFVNDLVSEGLLLAYSSDMTSAFHEQTIDCHLEAFVSAYLGERAVNGLELAALNNLYCVLRPFWFSRLTSSQHLLEKQASDELNHFLEMTRDLLEGSPTGESRGDTQ